MLPRASHLRTVTLKRASCSPVDGRARISRVKRRYFIVSSASFARVKTSPHPPRARDPRPIGSAVKANLRLIASSRAGVRTQPRTLARALALARAHRKNTHFLLSPRLLLTTGGGACEAVLEIPARRGREPCRGWVSRLVHRTTSRARESHSRDATRRRDEKRARRRRASRVVRVRSRSRSATIPSVLQRRIDAQALRGRARGARDVCMCLITGLMVRTIKCITLVFLFVIKGRVGRRRARRGRGRQRPAGVARRRARDGDSR